MERLPASSKRKCRFVELSVVFFPILLDLRLIESADVETLKFPPSASFLALRFFVAFLQTPLWIGNLSQQKRKPERICLVLVLVKTQSQ